MNSIDVTEIQRAVRQHRPARYPEHHRFVFVGQLIQRKNVDGLLRAFAQLPGDPTLDVIGDGVERTALELLADKLSVADRVHWLGYVEPSAVPVHLASAQTLVLASHTEVWGMAVTEALACGLSVVVARDAGVSSSLAGLNGVYLCDAGSGSVASAMLASANAWNGWDDDENRAGTASADRAASDAVSAVQIAMKSRPGRRFR